MCPLEETGGLSLQKNAQKSFKAEFQKNLRKPMEKAEFGGFRGSILTNENAQKQNREAVSEFGAKPQTPPRVPRSFTQ
jgi:hypothetical protein